MQRFLKQLDQAQKSGYEFVQSNPVLLKRIDINSVMPSSSRILNDRRIREALETTIELRKAGATAIGDASHQSRKGKADFYPTLHHADIINTILKEKYPSYYEEWEYVFDETCWGVTQLQYLIQNRNVLSNNLRFAPWELRGPAKLSEIPPVLLINKLLNKGIKVGYVQDAFPSAHRGGKHKDTSMNVLPMFLKQREIPVFPSKAFVNEMGKFAELNELIRKSKKVIVALFGAKVTDYINVFSLYTRYDHTEFLAGSLLSLVLLKTQHPSMALGPNEDVFFKDVSAKDLAEFKENYNPDRVHLAQDVLVSTPEKIQSVQLSSQSKFQHLVEGIGPETATHFTKIVDGAQLIIINGCPCNINQFDTFGGPFKEFLTHIRKQNGGLKIYECGGDAITATKFTAIQPDFSSTAGKVGLMFPVIETLDDLQKFAPAVLPLLD